MYKSVFENDFLFCLKHLLFLVNNDNLRLDTFAMPI